jgi:hypothetical protein
MTIKIRFPIICSVWSVSVRDRVSSRLPERDDVYFTAPLPEPAPPCIRLGSLGY